MKHTWIEEIEVGHDYAKEGKNTHFQKLANDIEQWQCLLTWWIYEKGIFSIIAISYMHMHTKTIYFHCSCTLPSLIVQEWLYQRQKSITCSQILNKQYDYERQSFYV